MCHSPYPLFTNTYTYCIVYVSSEVREQDCPERPRSIYGFNALLNDTSAMMMGIGHHGFYTSHPPLAISQLEYTFLPVLGIKLFQLLLNLSASMQPVTSKLNKKSVRIK